MFRNTGANAFARNQMRLAYEDKRDLYCMYSSVVASKLGKCFPPWTVTHVAWTAASGPERAKYRVYGGNLPHHSLCGSFMAKFSGLTHQASADARSAAKRCRDSIRVYFYTYSCTSLTGPSHIGLCPSGPEVCTRQSRRLPEPQLMFPL